MGTAVLTANFANAGIGAHRKIVISALPFAILSKKLFDLLFYLDFYILK